MSGDFGLFLVFVLLAVAGIVWIRSYTARLRREAAEYPEPTPYEPLPSLDDPAGMAVPPVTPVPAPVPAPAPIAPAVGEHVDVIAASHDQAVLLRREVPPRPGAASHWGGVPSVPRDFTWPFFVTEGGSERAMHLVLQLDLAAVPAEGRLGLLPDRGMLYVFLDLDWGHHWRWSVRHVDAGPDGLVAATVPASLPHAYASPTSWGWPRGEADWPFLLPEWSLEPVLVTAAPDPVAVDEDERHYWPGTIPLEARVSSVDGGVVPTRWYANQYDDGVLVRPWASYPHDWRAVTILMGHLARQAGRGHLDNHVRRAAMTEAEAAEQTARLRDAVASWTSRAAAEAPWDELPVAERDAVWQLVLDHQPVALFGLADAVDDSIEATLSGNRDATSVLPPEAVDLVRSRHALAGLGDDGRLHVADTARMLCAPSHVQGDAEERIGEWLLLLEMSATPSVGHHFAEGVYQFWIRPADLAARRFDLVELTASAY